VSLGRSKLLKEDNDFDAHSCRKIQHSWYERNLFKWRHI